MAPEPWRNGAGTTRELASRTDAGGELLWRISLASLDDDAAFSVFAGLDRLFVALAPLRLVVAAKAMRWPPASSSGSPVKRPSGSSSRDRRKR